MELNDSLWSEPKSLDIAYNIEVLHIEIPHINYNIEVPALQGSYYQDINYETRRLMKSIPQRLVESSTLDFPPQNYKEITEGGQNTTLNNNDELHTVLKESPCKGNPQGQLKTPPKESKLEAGAEKGMIVKASM